MHICDTLGVDLTAGHSDELQHSVSKAISKNDQGLVDDYIEFIFAERQAMQR